MSAPSTRRHVAFYLSVPTVVAIAFLLVVRLAAMHRADFIAELVDVVMHHDPPQAAAAVRQLAEIPRPPIGVLVEAATSGEREVAGEAQQAISKILRRAQRQIDAKRGYRGVARQLGELAEALAERREMFLRSDHDWVAATARKVVRMANQLPPRHSPLVAMHCDAILSAVAPTGEARTEVAKSNSKGVDPFVAAGAPVERRLQSRQEVLPREVAVASPAPPAAALAPERTQVSTTPVGNPTAETSPERSSEDSWRATWSNPMLRIPSASAVDAAPREEDTREPNPLSPMPDSVPTDTAPSDRPLAGAETRTLLRDWLQVNGVETVPLEQELNRRGFAPLSQQLVQLYLSKRPDDRLRLVDDILIEPGVDARPWLMLLADDGDADVRLAAVTIMATSNDVALVEKAWQVAIQDRDPRVAELAGRLRDRRANLQR